MNFAVPRVQPRLAVRGHRPSLAPSKTQASLPMDPFLQGLVELVISPWGALSALRVL